MKEKPAVLEYGMSNAVSPEENILRGLFTYFLNLGSFDARMAEARLQPKSARTDHVGLAFLALHREAIRDEFVAWSRSDSLASYLVNDQVRDAIRERFKANAGMLTSPVDSILGTRYKLITGFDRKRLPKDLKKSFYTKAYNRLVKFVQEYAQSGEGVADVRTSWNQDGDESKPRVLSVEEWLRLALSPKGKQLWFQSENLREIRNLYQNTMKHEPVGEVVEELMRQAAVAGVMLS